MSRHPSLTVVLTGILLGVAALLLAALGNPGNMGFCIACFLRDAAGALGLHAAANVQYFRPETVGLVLGALAAALAFREFRPKGGSSPMTRFFLGAVVMIGALMFLGCPLRMVLRLGNGDWNALLGLPGFVAGIGCGAWFLNRGFSLRRAYGQSRAEGLLFPLVFGGLLVLSLLLPGLFLRSAEGPGAQAAPWILSLVCGLGVGFLCQRSRFCMAGGFRDVFLFRDFHLISGFAALLVTVVLGNLILGSFHGGFAGQPVAHTDGLWNFLGMAVVGWGSVLLGGCPLRQLILAGEGNTDSALTICGMVAGAALCHNWRLASSPAGPTLPGQIAVGCCLAVLLVLSIVHTKKEA